MRYASQRMCTRSIDGHTYAKEWHVMSFRLWINSISKMVRLIRIIVRYFIKKLSLRIFLFPYCLDLFCLCQFHPNSTNEILIARMFNLMALIKSSFSNIWHMLQILTNQITNQWKQSQWPLTYFISVCTILYSRRKIWEVIKIARWSVVIQLVS